MFRNLQPAHYYELGYQALSWDLKNYFSNGDLVLLTYDMGASAHVVTLWGAELILTAICAAFIFLIPTTTNNTACKDTES